MDVTVGCYSPHGVGGDPGGGAAEVPDALPNIVWIMSEDMGPDLGCYGTNVHTPNIDRLAREGARYTRLFGTASVCMPNRTAMVTGVHQASLGAVTMRPPKEFMRPLPGDVKPLPALLRDRGYFTANIRNPELGFGAKNDWNFRYEGPTWHTRKLEEVPLDRPLFLQFNIFLPHRPYKQDEQHPVDPATVAFPPYYPDHPVVRQSWSDYLESIQHMDRSVGNALDWIDKNGLADNTIVIYTSDHGEAFLRGKYFLYDCSLNQPLVVRWPEACDPPAGLTPGSRDDRLIAAIDLAAQIAQVACGEVPDWMHGRAILGPQTPGRDAIYSAADWIGEARLKSRSVRTDRYRYIVNHNTDLSVQNASTAYRIAMHPMHHLVEILDERGALSASHRRMLLDPLPAEELYDLEADPHELNNLARDPAMADTQSPAARSARSVDHVLGRSGFRASRSGSRRVL